MRRARSPFVVYTVSTYGRRTGPVVSPALTRESLTPTLCVQVPRRAYPTTSSNREGRRRSPDAGPTGYCTRETAPCIIDRRFSPLILPPDCHRAIVRGPRRGDGHRQNRRSPIRLQPLRSSAVAPNVRVLGFWPRYPFLPPLVLLGDAQLARLDRVVSRDNG